jgi:hypothetical protein
VVLALAVDTERRLDHVAVLIEHIGLGLVALEVGGGRVEEQQIDLEVQQVSGLEVHLLGELVVDLQQPVHRAVAGVLIQLWEAVDPRALIDPLARRQLAQRLKGAVGDHREQHALGPWIQAPTRQQPVQRAIDPQDLPQAVQRPRPTDRTGLHELKAPGRAAGHQRLIGLKEPAQRPDQPADRRAVQLILTPEAVQHTHDRVPRHRVPLVVRQLQIPDLAAVFALTSQRPVGNLTRHGR